MIILICSIIIFFYMTALFLYALFRKDNSIVDSGFGIAFIIIALYSLISMDRYCPRHILVTGLILIWGIRISAHIMYKNWGKGEDERYAKFRKQWKHYFIIRSFLLVFMLQGVVILIMSQPVLLINSSYEDHITILDIIGTALWIIGFMLESVADYQLLRFKSDIKNKGHLLQEGLWRYSRHPNYFGEALMWWGIFCIALSVPHGWTAIMSPATITFLLMYVSGVPPAEELLKNNPEYPLYARRTSTFFPWFPKD